MPYIPRKSENYSNTKTANIGQDSVVTHYKEITAATLGHPSYHVHLQFTNTHRPTFTQPATAPFLPIRGTQQIDHGGSIASSIGAVVPADAGRGAAAPLRFCDDSRLGLPPRPRPRRKPCCQGRSSSSTTSTSTSSRSRSSRSRSPAPRLASEPSHRPGLVLLVLCGRHGATPASFDSIGFFDRFGPI